MPRDGRARAGDNGGPTPPLGANIGRQALRREVNRRISERGGADGVLDVFCECGQSRCSERLAIDADRYAETRRIPTHFLIKHGHASEEERVIGDHGEFLVVEKYGPSGMAAVRLAREPAGRTL